MLSLALIRHIANDNTCGCHYEIDADTGDELSGLGKFAGHARYVPHFYSAMLDGAGEEMNTFLCSCDCHDEADDPDIYGPDDEPPHEGEPCDCTVTVLQIDDSDRRLFPELVGHTEVAIWSDEQGFIYSDLDPMHG